MTRVLMIHYYFPPLGGAGSVRALNFARHLPDAGWNVTVLAPSNGAYHQDPDLDATGIEVERSHSFELARIGKRLVAAEGGDTRPARLGPIRGALRSLAHRWFYFPDAHVGWFPSAVRAGRRLAERNRFDAIFSSSGPVTAHLVARRLHKDTGIPWVAEFRDPWADRAPDRATEARRRRLENALVTDASAVVTVSPTWKRMFLEKGARAAHVVTNGFDPLKMPPPAASQGFVVTYLGSLYPGLQDLGPVWEALSRMRPALGTTLRIRFIGEVPGSLRQEVAAYRLDDALEVTGYLPYLAALEQATASSVLLAAGFQGGSAVDDGLIPAKLFEYLAMGLPIVYLGPVQGDAGRLLSLQPACHVVEPGDREGTLGALVTARAQGRIQRDLTPYTRQALARQLADILASVRE